MITEEHLKKTLLGRLSSLSDVIESFMYAKPYNVKDQDGLIRQRCTRVEEGYIFCGSEDRRLVMFPPGKNHWHVLHCKVRDAVMDACDWRCMEGRIRSIKVIPWKDDGMALITATDKTMIPSIWIGFVPLDSIPEINFENTPTYGDPK